MSGFDILDSVEQGLAPKQVGIQEFSESSTYCNKFLYPRQTVLLKLIFLEEMTGAEEDILSHWMEGGRNGNEIHVSPNIRERRDFLRENGYKHFREVCLVGGRRSSKGFVTGMAMSKVMFDTLQLGDPGGYYGIDPTKDIYFSCVAGSESQAKQYQYADLVSTIETCKAFDPYLQKSLETEFHVATETDLRRMNANKARGAKGLMRSIAKIRGNALAANAGTLRGSATMAICIDEMAHMLPGESKASAGEVYNAADPSLDQFNLDGLMFLNSSPYTKVGMFYECYENSLRPFDPTLPVTFASAFNEDDDAEVGNGNPRNFVFQYPSWALFEGYRYYKSRYKQKERGKEFGSMITVSPDWDPEETDAQERPKFTDLDKANIIQARAKEQSNPETYKVERRGKFAEVTDAYLNPSMVEQMYRGVPTGFDYMPNGDVMRSFKRLETNHGRQALNLYRYKFHIDPSSTTAGFGFAIAHTELLINADGTEQEHVVFDLIKRWDPKSFQGKVIRWDPILKEIYKYAEIFMPFEITLDQHQSAEPIQRLQEMLTERSIPTRVYEKFACQPLDARILTPHGWTTMGEVHEGDVITGSDGQATTVIGVYPQNELKDVYRIGFSDGSSTECTDDHLWRVQTHDGHKKTLTLKEMMDAGLRYGDKGSWKFGVQHVAPIEYVSNDLLPLDPYLLGSLLGDGCFHKSVWMASARDDADEQESLIKSLLPEHVSITRRNRGGWDTFYFKKDDGLYCNPLSQIIRDLGLWYVAGQDKFVPDVYLRASVAERISLLQGLMDTDGHAGSAAYRVSFTTTSWHLAHAVCELVGSLGGSATVRMTSPERSTIEVFIKRLPAPINPFRIARKRNQYVQRTQRSGQYRFLTSVELLGPKETQCIRVDNDDHLYVTDDFIVTHNTNELNWKRWEVFKTALYQGLVHAPDDEYRNPSAMGTGTFTSKDELKFLQKIATGGKFERVEKQDIGPVQTKDMADCICECTYSLVGNLYVTQMRDRLANSSLVGGAPGGYGIGQGGPMGSPGPAGISGYYSNREQKIMNGQGAPGWGNSSANLTRSATAGRGRGRGSRSRGRY
jgi:hypothetical protein